MTKFLADENIPSVIADFLRNKGFDVKEVCELETPGASDAEIIELARRENRALVTFDKHFADILLYPPHGHHGVLRLRFHPPLLSEIIRALEHFLQAFDLTTIKGTLIVLERDGFRVRRTS